MTAYPLAPLLRVRAFRETAAAAEVTAARLRLEEAQAEVERAEQALVEYREWRLAEEARLFDEIRRREIPVRGLDEHKQRLLALRGREVQFEEAIQQARAAVETAREALEAARAAHRRAIQEKRKIEEHREIWREEARREEARAADLELEEFGPRDLSAFEDEPPDDSEWAAP